MKVADLEGGRLEYWLMRIDGSLDETASPSDADIFDGMTMYGWSEMGPIMERERISVLQEEGRPIEACKNFWYDESGGWRGEHLQQGPTALIAVKRCYIASKFGDEVPE